MTDRFDLEQQILEMWGTAEDIMLVCEAVMEQDLTTDKIANLLIGLSELHQLKSQKAFNTFETLIRENKL